MERMNRMFNMTKIGKKLCTLRKEHNMTQVELADQLGISYQAVSNWERGNSMPDISKLPELAAIFGLSIDELIGEKSVLIEAAVNNELVECIARNEISGEDLDNTLPLLKPSQVEAIVRESDLLSSQRHRVHISALLPYLDESDVQKLAFKALEEGKSIKKYLPFMNEKDVMALADKTFEKGESVKAFLPFISKDHIRSLADKTLEKGESIKAFLPFLDHGNVSIFAAKTFETGGSFKAFLPFMDEKDVSLFADKTLEKGDSINAFLPFLAQDEVSRFAAKTLEMGGSIDAFLPFMSSHVIRTLAFQNDEEK